MKNLVSVVIRTLNEERHLNELLKMISLQKSNLFDIEIVIVDSGSTDRTLEIAAKYRARITYINKKDFSFGRSLNIGCDFANGDFLVFVSGHCIPTSESWLHELVKPLLDNKCNYSYGRQEARDTTKFSEQQLFKKYFPIESKIPQVGFFCNNANAAIKKSLWLVYKFNENITGCEDMFLSKQLVEDKFLVGYVASASVYHIHDESWDQVRNRYERESIALQDIVPELQLSKKDVLRYFLIGVIKDFRAAINNKSLTKNAKSIILFRWAQYMGAYAGNHHIRKISQELKDKYFYPRNTNMDIKSRK
jgi:rhamnosyltransferase